MARKKATRRKRSTRKGMIRKTSRRAYFPKTRRARARRRNPVGVTGTPAFRFGAYAVAGSVAFSVVKASGLGSKLIPSELTRSLVFAGATIALASMAKGRTKSNLIALGVGMTAIPIVGAADKAIKDSGIMIPKLGNGGSSNGSSNGSKSGTDAAVAEIQRRSNRSAFQVAMQHSQRVASGGLGSF
jgi:hypothetical protein